ncbi:hypothetical protein JXM67_12285 [candidate division WOR-3 bacterium]|nr:hypothetical protein [candidate division WOR-3 bacterium]
MNYELRYIEELQAVHLKVKNMLTAKDVRGKTSACIKMLDRGNHHCVLNDDSEAKGVLEEETLAWQKG